MRIAPMDPPRSDETPRCSYIIEEKLIDGSILRIEPSSSRGNRDQTPCCVVTAQQMMPRARTNRLRFGDWLVRRGLITRPHLFAALSCARRGGGRLGDALVALALLERDQVEDEAASFATFTAWR